MISAGAGYALASMIQTIPSSSLNFPLVWLTLGLYLVVSGSFILNQVYEYRLDRQMNRTLKRPLPGGRITWLQALSLGVIHIVPGLFILLALNPVTAGLALLAVLLYNVFYTILWKTKWIFAAIPGALPGALPVMIGYSAASSEILSHRMSLFIFYFIFMANASFLGIGHWVPQRL